MTRMVQCAKLGKELPGVVYKPFENDLGQRIFDTISMDAWRLWIEHSKRIVNEYRLDLTSPRGQQLLLDEAEKFFFGQGGQAPPDYKPEG
jgi:Fe-S cluster biosynthesis and repair protein YggX